ncbi:hypothetical protein [Tropicibacter sp. S64]|uniref:hypothetical protein n=1 Tax=Tropicibacter sp. S64 TaxID=3415122 RepID=UPI003C7D678A
MSRKFITTVLAVAATITALAAAPVRADHKKDGLQKVIIGATVLYLTSRMIEDLSRKGVTVYPYGQRYGSQQAHGYGNNGRHGDWDRGRDWKKKDRRPDLPASCIRRIEKRGETVKVMPRHCLEKNDISTRRLPDRCEIDWRGKNGRRTGYAVHCLTRSGYDIARRR